MPEKQNKLAVIVHGNDEVTLKDERGKPNICKDCRFSGWLTQYEFKKYRIPTRCLLFSGGGDPVDGDRVILDKIKKLGYKYGDWNGYVTIREATGHRWAEGKYGDRYPLCSRQNQDGKCQDFVKAKPVKNSFFDYLFFWRLRKNRRKLLE